MGRGKLAGGSKGEGDLSLGVRLLTFARVKKVIPKLAPELGVEAVFANRRYEPYAAQRDDKIFDELNALGMGFEVFKDAVRWGELE